MLSRSFHVSSRAKTCRPAHSARRLGRPRAAHGEGRGASAAAPATLRHPGDAEAAAARGVDPVGAVVRAWERTRARGRRARGLWRAGGARKLGGAAERHAPPVGAHAARGLMLSVGVSCTSCKLSGTCLPFCQCFRLSANSVFESGFGNLRDSSCTETAQALLLGGPVRAVRRSTRRLGKPAWRRPNEAIGKPDDDAAVHALPNISKAHLSEGAAPARPGGGRDAAVQ